MTAVFSESITTYLLFRSFSSCNTFVHRI